MHTINTFYSRSYNAKVTNWRILELKGLRQRLSYLLAGYEVLNSSLNAVDDEIEQTKKAYTDYLRTQFGVGAEPLKKLKEKVWLGDVDEKSWQQLLTKRGGCSCHLSPPCHNCTEPCTEQELNRVGYTYGF